MMHAHPDKTQTRRAEPSAVQCVGASFRVGFVCDYDGKRTREGANAFFGHEIDDGVAVLGVEGLDGVCDGVDPACSTETFWEGECEVDVVDDNLYYAVAQTMSIELYKQSKRITNLREDFGSDLCGLNTVLRLTDNGCHFRS